MKEVVRASQVYSPNTRSFDIPPTAARKFIGANVILTRESWPSGVPYTNPSGMTYQDIVLVIRLDSSLDGVTFGPQFDVPCPGGVRKYPTSESRFSFTQERDGDLRFTIINFVTLRTAITLQMLEPGD
jgi:hypothetical protein